MRAVGKSGIRRLRGLKNISWLTSRQLHRLANALTMSRVGRHGIIFDEKHAPESVYLLLSGVARITCRNRKGDRTLVIMVAPGMIPGFPPPVSGIRYNFRCEAVTDCRIGVVGLERFIEIALGIASADFKRMAASYSGRWDLVQLRCEFHELHAGGTSGADTAGAEREFRRPRWARGTTNGGGAAQGPC
jgi:cyclic nucleotide-binding protein